ncbi:MAG: RagB/SusD family nutrient uptake outer membrane protein [Sphingobacteriaceae bacterium]|nr:RagB/SusD family nutrient uptake outer membrane protein [Sphingobacteriaceae bacterium]
MKKINIILLVGVISLFSCKKTGFLDPTNTGLSEEEVFSDSLRTMQFLGRAYEDIAFAFLPTRWDAGNTNGATDDTEFINENVARRPVIIYSGTYNAASFPFDGMWNMPWQNIRRASLLMQKLPETPLAPATKSRVTGEARFLRAYYYAYLLVNFGGVPLIGDRVFGKDDVVNLPRNSFQECVDYIVSELDAAAALVPPTTGPGAYDDTNWGRVTRGACMGLKSRVLLYAASPLFNAGISSYETLKTDEAGKLVSGYTDKSASSVQQRWQRAADAALAVMNSGYYELHTNNTTAPGYGFYDVFLKRVNREYIFFQNRPLNRDFEGMFNPPSRGGSRVYWPSQNLVDCFPMKNGKGILEAGSTYDPQNPYANRDPRFGYTIIYNGSFYYLASAGVKREVFTYQGASQDGFPSTKSGYYLRKMCDDNVANNSNFQTQRGWPLLRYAEIILNYAEAINEASSGPAAPEAAYAALRQLRNRAGIDVGDGNYGLKSGMTQVEMRAVVRNERRIELSFEGDHRWNDICRWGIAEAVNNGYNQIMRIVRVTAAPLVYQYNREPSTRLHRFRPEMYLFPIKQSEINKMPAMVQNPGW